MFKILCDWDDEVSHYSLPIEYVKLIQSLCSINSVQFLLKNKFNDSEFDNSVLAYIGNKPDERLRECDNLRWIHFGSVGTDRIDCKYYRNKGCFVTNAGDSFSSSVAVYCLHLLLNKCLAYDDSLGFNRLSYEQALTKLSDIHVVILGMGSIAQKLTELLSKLSISFSVVTRNPHKYKIKFPNYFFYSYDDNINFPNYNENLVIVNLLPSKFETNQFVNKKYLAKFSSIYFYINLGRSATESLDDITFLLDLKSIKYAHWDVYRDVEIVNNLKSRFMGRLSFSPHVSSFSYYHWDSSFEIMFNNLKLFFSKDYSLMGNQVHE